MNRSLNTIILLLFFFVSVSVAQHSQRHFLSSPAPMGYHNNVFLPSRDTVDSPDNNTRPVRDPKAVMFKSMIIPGWGQIKNKQVWKVPIIYGLLGGLTWYSIQMTQSFHDYRAAYYNLNPDTPDDMRFGPTPGYIPENSNLEQLREIRNSLRNRRDFIYIALGLTYGLNIVDAYVFAHMRSFDVSEDLSMKTTIRPSIIDRGSPGFTLSIELFNKHKAR